MCISAGNYANRQFELFAEHASAHRAYIMFRTLGLRHLVVVNHYNEVMGMITRENLLPEHFGAGGAYSSAHHDQDGHGKLSAA